MKQQNVLILEEKDMKQIVANITNQPVDNIKLISVGASTTYANASKEVIVAFAFHKTPKESTEQPTDTVKDAPESKA